MTVKVNQLIDEGLARIEAKTERDREFLQHFGKWMRPQHLPRYNLDQLRFLIRWLPETGDVIDMEPFLNALEAGDRAVAAQIARFVGEQYVYRPATDKTLYSFRIEFLMRLDMLGF